MDNLGSYISILREKTSIYGNNKRIEHFRRNRKERKKCQKRIKKKLTQRERFIKYREKRLKRAIEAIGLCENMANKNSYENSDEEAKVIIKNLQDALSNLRHAFTKVDRKKMLLIMRIIELMHVIKRRLSYVMQHN